jgi:hypothetical protein
MWARTEREVSGCRALLVATLGPGSVALAGPAEHSNTPIWGLTHAGVPVQSGGDADRWVSMPNGAPRKPWPGSGECRTGPDAGAVAIRAFLTLAAKCRF